VGFGLLFQYFNNYLTKKSRRFYREGMKTETSLFSPLSIRGLELSNRLVMPPMCQYSAVDGLVQPWHLRHYAERAVGGVGLVIVEATAVQARGRISPADLGLWNDAQRDALRPLVDAVHAAGAKIAVQLAHAGRKASTHVPWLGTGAVPAERGGWTVVSASEGAFDPTYPSPVALDRAGFDQVAADFAAAARRAVDAGFDAVEIHGAHGYLIHQFLSPLTNKRTDAYGGSQENRFRLAIEVTRAIRTVLPPSMPLLIRVSATDWVEGGWTVEETVALLKILKNEGVDFADVSSGGLVPGVKIPLSPGYQVPLAAQVRRETGLLTGAVGLITDAAQAQAIVGSGEADAVLLGRLLLRDPHFPNRTAPADRKRIPSQYLRAF
jgi:2,4-dienoyl-CoA reductase-like NADH-dependent reductase (Old Yellow Enzyme family)